MLIERIILFLKVLKEEHSLSKYDKAHLISLESRFKDKDPLSKLDEKDIAFMTQLFSTRWEEVRDDSDDDYTLNSAGNNRFWIEIAKELSTCVNKNYLEILIPTNTATIDCNNLTPLHTKDLEDLYLGDSDCVLYSKKALSTHLSSQDFILSTCRELHTKTLKPLTVKELTRLRDFKPKDGTSFLLGKEEFANFWDFLNKKVFTRLHVNGQLLPHILQDFKSLCKKYYELKEKPGGFNLFKDEVNQFLQRLYKCPLDNVNYFYGCRISYNHHEYYLVELLINLCRASAFTSDPEMSLFVNFIERTEKLDGQKSKPSSPTTSKAKNSSDEIAQLNDSSLKIGSFLLSLFSKQIKFYRFNGNEISFWDMNTRVSSEAAKFFNQLLPAINTNNYPLLCAKYKEVLQQVNELACSDNQSNHTVVWCNHVHKGTLTEMNVHWHEPAVILQGLLHFKCKSGSVLNNAIDKFLFEFLNTYIHKKSGLLRALRINILLADFLNSCSKDLRETLLDTFNKINLEDAKLSFIENCSAYIGLRLTQIQSDCKSMGSLKFFGGDPSLTICCKELHTLSEVVEAYKSKVHPLKNQKMNAFLVELEALILSESQEEVVNFVGKLTEIDTLNAPT